MVLSLIFYCELGTNPPLSPLLPCREAPNVVVAAREPRWEGGVGEDEAVTGAQIARGQGLRIKAAHTSARSQGAATAPQGSARLVGSGMRGLLAWAGHCLDLTMLQTSSPPYSVQASESPSVAPECMGRRRHGGHMCGDDERSTRRYVIGSDERTGRRRPPNCEDEFSLCFGELLEQKKATRAKQAAAGLVCEACISVALCLLRPRSVFSRRG